MRGGRSRGAGGGKGRGRRVKARSVKFQRMRKSIESHAGAKERIGWVWVEGKGT